VIELSNRAVAAFRTWDGPVGYAIVDWPHGSCDFASYVIAGTLLERGFGEWDITWNSSRSSGATHTWVELVEEGRLQYVIDRTAHQFPSVTAAPYFGPGPNPLRAVFDNELGRSPITSLYWGRGIYADALSYVSEVMGRETQ